MAFVGVCILFQAITSDIYVYNNKTTVASPTAFVPTTAPLNASTMKSLHHWQLDKDSKLIKQQAANIRLVSPAFSVCQALM